MGHYNNAGTLLETLNTGAAGSEDTGMCFDTTGNLYATNFQAGTLTKFDNAGNLVQSSWGGPYNTNPESCVVDGAGNMYVGSTYSGQLTKLDSSGHVLANLHPAAESRSTGSIWPPISVRFSTRQKARQSGDSMPARVPSSPTSPADSRPPASRFGSHRTVT